LDGFCPLLARPANAVSAAQAGAAGEGVAGGPFGEPKKAEEI